MRKQSEFNYFQPGDSGAMAEKHASVEWCGQVNLLNSGPSEEIVLGEMYPTSHHSEARAGESSKIELAENLDILTRAQLEEMQQRNLARTVDALKRNPAVAACWPGALDVRVPRDLLKLPCSHRPISRRPVRPPRRIWCSATAAPGLFCAPAVHRDGAR